MKVLQLKSKAFLHVYKFYVSVEKYESIYMLYKPLEFTLTTSDLQITNELDKRR